MIWAVLAAFAVVVMAPLALVLWRAAHARGRREAAMALHRAQLLELERDLAEGRLGPAEHATAVLEVQRRLLAAGGEIETERDGGARAPLAAALAIVPLAALGLYLIAGTPTMPAQPLAEREADATAQAQADEALVAQLRSRLTQIDPHSDQAREGYILLGNIEQGLGHWPDAAAAWRSALAVRFDPTLAAAAAEAATRADGHVGPEAAALFQKALQNAPPDAPWRGLAQQRLAEAAGAAPGAAPAAR